MKNLAIVVTALVLISFSCERGGKESSEKNNSKKADKVKLEIDADVDTLNFVWKAMIRSDDQKLADIKRLLLEVSYTERYDITLYDSAIAMQKRLPAKRYDQATMADSKLIDSYDAATDSLLRLTMKITSTAKGIDGHPLAAQLLNEIGEADNKVVRYRAEYDIWVKKYNKCLKDNDKQLKKLGEPYSSLTPKPLFEIGAQ